MNKEDFKQALREKLSAVPRETRKKWNDTDLLLWWGEVCRTDSYLRWERCPGDIWQSVKGFCDDMIGDNII